MEQNEWFRLTSLKNKRQGADAVILNEQIYVIGGFNGTYLSSVERYDFNQ